MYICILFVCMIVINIRTVSSAKGIRSSGTGVTKLLATTWVVGTELEASLRTTGATEPSLLSSQHNLISFSLGKEI